MILVIACRTVAIASTRIMYKIGNDHKPLPAPWGIATGAVVFIIIALSAPIIAFDTDIPHIGLPIAWQTRGCTCVSTQLMTYIVFAHSAVGVQWPIAFQALKCTRLAVIIRLIDHCLWVPGLWTLIKTWLINWIIRIIGNTHWTREGVARALYTWGVTAITSQSWLLLKITYRAVHVAGGVCNQIIWFICAWCLAGITLRDEWACALVAVVVTWFTLAWVRTHILIVLNRTLNQTVVTQQIQTSHTLCAIDGSWLASGTCGTIAVRAFMTGHLAVGAISAWSSRNTFK